VRSNLKRDKYPWLNVRWVSVLTKMRYANVLNVAVDFTFYLRRHARLQGRKKRSHS